MPTPVEIYEDMKTRCWEVDVLQREDDNGFSQGVGFIIRSQDGVLLTLEAGIDESGRGFATVRAFGTDGETLEPTVLHLDDSVLLYTPNN